jgi:S1-C subfamily serine protease
VAGINSSALGRDAALALPLSAVKLVIDAIRQHGHVKRGFIGVMTQPVRLAPNVAEELKQEAGLMIIGTEANGPAAKAGLLQGDVLVTLGGNPVSEIGDLQAALGPGSVSKTLAAKVIRGGKVTMVDVVVGTRE